MGHGLDNINVIMMMNLNILIGYLLVFYLGGSTDTMREKNQELEHEIQKRKGTEKELEEKITQLQSLMDTIPSHICFKDLECKYIGCNAAFIRDFAIEKKDFIDQSVYDILEFDSAEVHAKMDRALLNSKEEQVYETIEKYADGSLRNIICNKTLFADEDGNPLGIVGVMTDVTAQKEKEKLKQSIEEEYRIIVEMRKQDKMKTEFFSNISHELRTPINVILGATQLVEKYSQDSQYEISQHKIVKNVGNIKQNGLRLLRMVNNLIDITQIDANAFQLNLKNRDIVYIVEEISLSVADYVTNKEIEIQFDTDIEEKIMACDGEIIERIILNLLSNAIKFTQNGGSVFVNIFDSGNSICIQIRDTGMGIPPDKQNEIFQRFCQINPLFTRTHEGSGIGLSLVKSLVELQDGIITVESEIGIGTTFGIYLPCMLVKEEESLVEDVYGKEDKAEKIQLEFSDIYN